MHRFHDFVYSQILCVIHAEIYVNTTTDGPYHNFPDKMKDATVAKVAAQAADFYRDACRAAQATAVKQQWDKVSCWACPAGFDHTAWLSQSGGLKCTLKLMQG